MLKACHLTAVKSLLHLKTVELFRDVLTWYFVENTLDESKNET